MFIAVEQIAFMTLMGTFKPDLPAAERTAAVSLVKSKVSRSINTIVVHTLLLPDDRRDPVVLGQAQRLLSRSLEPVNDALESKAYLIGDFSGADVMLGHACFMANRMGCVPEEMTQLKAYVVRVAARPAFQTAITMQ